MHATAGKERLVRFDVRSVEDLERITRRIGELHDLEHPARPRQVFATHLERNTGRLQNVLHRPEFFDAPNAQTRSKQIVRRVLFDDDPVVPIVGAQVQPVRFTRFFEHFESQQIACKIPPCSEI